jgi:hypothetical protein
MTRLVALLALTTVALVLPAAARADGITANCASGGVTTGCSSSYWYTSDVTVSFILPAGSSNPQGCGNVTISSDTSGQTITCTVSVSGTQCCRLDVTIKRDATPPTTTGMAASRPPDANGWYNHPVGISVSGTDATSGVAGCTATTFSGPDSSSATVSGTCVDNAGNVSAPRTLTFLYDATPPSVSPSPSRGADANGWYNHPVDVSFQGSDAASGVDSCTSASYSGPDNGSASVGGTCRDKAGNAGSGSFALRYDATPPQVTGASPARAPDHDGWYNQALAVTFAGADATSGIASCDALSYAKPDAADASLAGRCRDNAGNVSAPGVFSFKFDSTPPKLAKLAVNAQDDAVALTWSVSTDVTRMTILRTRSGATAPVTLYDGKRIAAFTDKKARNGSKYAYAVTAFDDAGNAAVAKTSASPSASLLAPRRAAKIGAGATLRWRPVAGATYYNVQLWLRGKKVLTTWPSGPSLHLPRLAPGPYTWFVWPGRGPRSLHRYGPLLGSSTFVVGR